MKIYNKIFLGLLSVILFTSCNDYLDENISPNSPLITDLAPNKTLSAAQTELFRVITGDNQNYESSVRTSSLNQLGSIWTGVWSADVNRWTGAYTEEYTGNISSSFYDEIWDWTYLKVGNLQNIIQYDSENYDNHKAIAMILKSFYMQYIVDLYGDVPYSEAWQFQPTPGYDNQKDVYMALYNQIDDAIALIENADSNDNSVGGEDVIFAGDMQSWKAFANTLKLKFLIRQSEAPDAEITSFVASEMNELRNANFITSDVTINPGYSDANADSQNPFYGAYGFNASGDAVRIRTLPVASEYIAEILNPSRTNDPRRSEWFLPEESTGDIIGIKQGDVSTTAPDDPSYFGTGVIPLDTSVGSAMDGYMMLLSEAKFLLAEAEHRYGGFPQSAEGYFDEGVEASFVRFGIESEYSDYMNNVDNLDGFGWNGTSDKIEVIINQKWLALMLTNGMESYLDKLRTGYPEAPLPLSNTMGGFPKRLMYPSSEIRGNAVNVPNVTRAEAYQTGAFWVPN